MNEDARTFAWDQYGELRKELIELQKTRAQVIGFKFTFVAAGIGLIAGNLKDLSPLAFFVPALAAVFFDILVHSFSFSIKRTGYYCRHYLEPLLRRGNELPDAGTFPMWEEFMAESPRREGRMRVLVLVGTLGTTLLMAAPALGSRTILVDAWARDVWAWLTVAWLVLFGFDVWATLAPLSFWQSQDDGERQKRLLVWVNGTAPPRSGVGVFLVQGDKVWFAVRKYDPAKGELDLIGGFVEPNESAEDALVREVEQETKLAVRREAVTYLGSLPDTYGDDKVPTLNLIYVVTDETSAELVARDDVERLAWRSPNDLPKQFAFPHQNGAVGLFKAWWEKRQAAPAARSPTAPS